MRLTKDGLIKSLREVRALYPDTSFSESETFASLGWVEYISPTPPPPTPEQIKTQLTFAVQNHLDESARLLGYDNIVSACSYAGAPNPFQAEGQSFISWRGEVWTTCFTLMTEVEAGRIPIPTADELLALLPIRVPA